MLISINFFCYENDILSQLWDRKRLKTMEFSRKLFQDESFHRFVRIILKCTLAYPSSEHYAGYAHSFYFIFCFFVSMTGILLNFTKLVTVSQILTHIPYLLYLLFFYTVIWQFFTYRHLSELIYRQIFEGVYTYRNSYLRRIHRETINDRMIEISRKFFKYGRIAIILFVSPLFAPAFAPLLQLTDDYSKYLYAPWYLPYVISDIRVYYLTYAFQTAIMLPSYILTSVAVIQPLYFWMVCRLQMFALTTILSNINERSVWDRVDHRPDEDIKSAISGLQTTDGYMFGYIQEVVEHHRSIIK